MSETPDTCGKRIRAAREARGLSIREVARQSGLDQAHLGRIERDLYDPSISRVCRIARVLGVCVGDLCPDAPTPVAV